MKFLKFLIIIFLGFSTESCFYDVDDIKSSYNYNVKTVLSINTSVNNPRNSEGDFIQLNNGRLLFIYSHFYGENASSDFSPANLCSRYSDDLGNTWSKEDKIEVVNDGEINIMSVSLLRLMNGDIALFYLQKNSDKDCIPMLRISKDEGRTWSSAKRCIKERKGYFVLTNGRVIQLKSGRILLPVSLHNTNNSKWSDKGNIYTYFSDDNGESWLSSTEVPNTKNIIIQEPGIIEKKDGIVMMIMRAEGGFQQCSFSYNSGETWSDIQTSNIASPLSCATIKKITNTDNWILLWNNTNGENMGYYDKKTPFTAAISKDEGTSWIYIKNIVDNPFGYYSYSSVYFLNNGEILVSVLTNELKTDILLLDKNFFY